MECVVIYIVVGLVIGVIVSYFMDAVGGTLIALIWSVAVPLLGLFAFFCWVGDKGHDRR